MVRWHINSSGVAGRCKAEEGNCPIAPNAPHFETAADARAAYEESMEESAVAESAKKQPKAMTAKEEVARKNARKSPRRVSEGPLPGHGVSRGHGIGATPLRSAFPGSNSFGFGHGGHGR